MSHLSIKSLHEAIDCCPAVKEEVASSLTGLAIEQVELLCRRQIYQYNNHSVRSVYGVILTNERIRLALSKQLLCTPADIQLILHASSGATSPLSTLLALPSDTLVHTLSFLSLPDVSGLDKAVCNWADRTVLFCAIHTERLVFTHPSRINNADECYLKWIRSRGVNLLSLDLNSNHILLQTHTLALDQVALRSVEKLRVASPSPPHETLYAALELVDDKCTAISDLIIHSQDPIFIDLCLKRLMAISLQIKTLSFRNSIVDNIRDFPSLTDLNLFSSKCKPQLIKGASLPQLLKLFAHGAVICDKAFSDMVERMPNLQNLRILNPVQLSEEGLCSQFVFLNNLQVFSFSSARTQDTLPWTRIFSELLNSCPLLTSLSISIGDVDDYNDRAFSRSVIPALKSNARSLCTLRLNGSIKLPSTVVAAIFKYCTHLEELSALIWKNSRLRVLKSSVPLTSWKSL